ncbi:hypothetical protein A6R68_01116, partial [Neotoma lepida]
DSRHCFYASAASAAISSSSYQLSPRCHENKITDPKLARKVHKGCSFNGPNITTAEAKLTQKVNQSASSDNKNEGVANVFASLFHKTPPSRFLLEPGLSVASCSDESPMDPLQKWDPMSISMPSHIATVTSSQEPSAGCQPSSSEKLSMGLSGLSLSCSPGSGVPAPLSQGLLQQPAREKKALWQQYWEKQGFPQRKKVFLRH